MPAVSLNDRAACIAEWLACNFLPGNRNEQAAIRSSEGWIAALPVGGGESAAPARQEPRTREGRRAC